MMTGELQIKVAQAVHVLNHDSLSCNRVAANQWLVQFQHSDAAWEVSTALLTSSPLVFDVQFFAAQILRRKIQHEGYCLQLPAKEALLNALLLAAKRFSLGPPQLLTQICLALSALVLRVSEHKQPIEQLFVSLHKLQSQDNGNIAVLEMLTVLPEEVAEDQNGDRNIDAANRSQYTRELLARTSTVLEFLLLQSENKFDGGIQLHVRNRNILWCLLSWVRKFAVRFSASATAEGFMNSAKGITLEEHNLSKESFHHEDQYKNPNCNKCEETKVVCCASCSISFGNSASPAQDEITPLTGSPYFSFIVRKYQVEDPFQVVVLSKLYNF